MVVKKTKKHLGKGKRTKKVCQKGGKWGKGKTKSTKKTNSQVNSAVLKYMNHILQSKKNSNTLSLSNELKKNIQSHLEFKKQRSNLLTSPNETIKLIKQNPNLINFLKLSTTSNEYSKLTPKQQKQYKKTIDDLLKPQKNNITVIKPNINEQTPLGQFLKSSSMLNLKKENNRNAAKKVSEILRSQDAPTDPNPLKYTLNQIQAQEQALQALNNARLGKVNPINPKTFSHLTSGPTYKTTEIILANGTKANTTGEILLPPIKKRKVPQPPTSNSAKKTPHSRPQPPTSNSAKKTPPPRPPPPRPPHPIKTKHPFIPTAPKPKHTPTRAPKTPQSLQGMTAANIESIPNTAPPPEPKLELNNEGFGEGPDTTFI